MEIQNTNGKYLIYEDGKIWSKKHKKFLKSYLSNSGYYRTCLSVDNKKSRVSTFFSPELKNGKKFPLKIKKQSCIFSLCALIVSCLKPDFNLENYREGLSSIEETKLYYALLRCLEEEPYNRYYLWI